MAGIAVGLTRSVDYTSKWPGDGCAHVFIKIVLLKYRIVQEKDSFKRYDIY